MPFALDASLYQRYNPTGVPEVVNYDATQCPQLEVLSEITVMAEKLPLCVLMPPRRDRLHRKTGHGGEI